MLPMKESNNRGLFTEPAGTSLDWTFLDSMLSPQPENKEKQEESEKESASEATTPAQAEKENAAEMETPTSPTPQLNRYRCALWRQKIKNQRLEKELKATKQTSIQDVLDITRKILQPRQQAFFKWQLELAAVKACGRRFTDEQVTESLALYYQGARAYRHLRKTFVLPSPRCLRKRMEGIQMKPGYQDWILGVMKEKFRGVGAHEKMVVLSFDEMQVRPKLSYVPTDDIVEGTEDFGDLGRSQSPADHALVFMARGVSNRWKQPIGYFLSQGPTLARVMQPLLESCIRKLRLAGFIVVASVCDMGTPNQELFKNLGVTTDSPMFSVDGENVVALHDVPHLLKCIRNTLLRGDVGADGKLASWNHIRQFYAVDSKRTIRSAPKLTQKHVFPGAFQKMKVRYATQILSRTVAAGISMYSAFGK